MSAKVGAERFFSENLVYYRKLTETLLFHTQKNAYWKHQSFQRGGDHPPPLVGSDHDKRFNGICYGFPKTKPKKTPQKSKLEKPTNIPKIKQSSS